MTRALARMRSLQSRVSRLRAARGGDDGGDHRSAPDNTRAANPPNDRVPFTPPSRDYDHSVADARGESTMRPNAAADIASAVSEARARRARRWSTSEVPMSQGQPPADRRVAAEAHDPLTRIADLLREAEAKDAALESLGREHQRLTGVEAKFKSQVGYCDGCG